MADQPVTGDLAERPVVIDGAPATLSVARIVPVGAKRLIWNEFFASRDRGIDWSVHLPWSARADTLCVSVATDGEAPAETDIVAALLVRPLRDLPVAMIGYVCVDSPRRGHGLSGIMIDAAAEKLATLGFTRMLLWTAKARVYESRGFSICGQERRIGILPPSPGAEFEIRTWPEPDSDIGLPPFATAGWSARTPEAHIVFVDTAAGPDLLDFHGEPSAVLQAMAGARPGPWALTLPPEHPLRIHAERHGCICSDAAGPFTMTRLLSTAREDDISGVVPVSPAFRI